MTLLSIVQRVARAVLGDYKVFAILTVDLPMPEAAPADASFVRIYSTPAEPAEGAGYAGEDAFGYEWREDGRRLCSCWVWYGDRYRRDRNYWPLKPGEAKLISLETKPEARGKGIAPRLIAHVCAHMQSLGFQRMYCRIWHSNTSSLRALAKAGWRRYATVVDIYPLGWRMRFVIRKRRHGGGASQTPHQIIQPVGGKVGED